VVTDPKTMRMSKEDFAQLKESLKKSGLTDADIEDLESRIDTPEGLTWGGFMSYLQTKITDKQSSAVLSVEDKRQVQSLLGKLGFTPGETSDLLSNLADGQAAKVWGVISGKLASLSDDASVSITPSETQSLARALGLSAGAQTRLAELVASLGESEEGARNIKIALLAIAAEVKDQNLSEAKNLAQVKELASQVFLASQKREFGQSLSDSREDQVARKAMLAREMAAEGADAAKDGKVSGAKSVADLNFAFQRMAETASGMENAAANEDDETFASATEQARSAMDGASNQNGHAATKQAAQTDAGQDGRNKSMDSRDGKNFTQSGFDGKAAASLGGKDADGTQNASDQDWAGFWGKIGVDGRTAKTQTAGDASSVLAGLTATVSSSAAQTAQTAQTATVRGADSYVSSDVLRQVENGLMQNLGQGAHRLTISLTPDELGTINVMLTVRDKDVQAVIKAETPEAAKIISEQLSRVREQLEEQGLKVSKLDVQTGLSQQEDQAAWQGAGQHNEAQRQQEGLSMMRTALRLLGVGSGLAKTADTVAASPVIAPRNEGVDVFA
jgi:flagellar hook-length control protein FliK